MEEEEGTLGRDPGTGTDIGTVVVEVEAEESSALVEVTLKLPPPPTRLNLLNSLSLPRLTPIPNLSLSSSTIINAPSMTAACTNTYCRRL